MFAKMNACSEMYMKQLSRVAECSFIVNRRRPTYSIGRMVRAWFMHQWPAILTIVVHCSTDLDLLSCTMRSA